MSSLTQSDRSSFCQKMNSSRWLLLALPLAAAPHLGAAGPEPALWSWQQTHAQVDPKGDLTWTDRKSVV